MCVYEIKHTSDPQGESHPSFCIVTCHVSVYDIVHLCVYTIDPPPESCHTVRNIAMTFQKSTYYIHSCCWIFHSCTFGKQTGCESKLTFVISLEYKMRWRSENILNILTSTTSL